MRRILTLLLLVIGMTATSMAQELAKTPSGENPMTFSVDGKTITVKLVGNSSTGYTWASTIADSTIVKAVMDEYDVPEASEGQNFVGQSGVHTFQLEAIKAGKTNVVFDYGQHWNNGRKGGIRTIQVKVAENLSVKVKEKK